MFIKNSKKIIILEYVIRATGVLFWFHLLNLIFLGKTYLMNMSVMISSIIVGFVVNRYKVSCIEENENNDENSDDENINKK